MLEHLFRHFYTLVSSRKLVQWAQAIAAVQAAMSIPTYRGQKQKAPGGLWSFLVVVLDRLLATFK